MNDSFSEAPSEPTSFSCLQYECELTDHRDVVICEVSCVFFNVPPPSDNCPFAEKTPSTHSSEMKYSISQHLPIFVQKHATENKVYFVCARSLWTAL